MLITLATVSKTIDIIVVLYGNSFIHEKMLYCHTTHQINVTKIKETLIETATLFHWIYRFLIYSLF